MDNVSGQSKRKKDMIIKDWYFCDQILQALAFLDKTLKIFILLFHSILILLYSNIFIHFNVPLDHGFSTIPNLLYFLKYLKSYTLSEEKKSP